MSAQKLWIIFLPSWWPIPMTGADNDMRVLEGEVFRLCKQHETVHFPNGGLYGKLASAITFIA